ncbi:MAG: O-antigen ligase family protein, partial [Patescibacteria group bacterium]
ERVATFDTAKQAFQEQPWVGIGPGQFGPYASINPFYEPKEGWKIVNNLTLELLAETGILGFLAIVTTFIIIFWRSLKALKAGPSNWLRALLIGSTAALLGILVQYQTFSILYIMHVWVAIGFLLSIQNIIFKQTK